MIFISLRLVIFPFPFLIFRRVFSLPLINIAKGLSIYWSFQITKFWFVISHFHTLYFALPFTILCLLWIEFALLFQCCRWKVKLLIHFSLFIIYEFTATHFLLSTALAASHKFGMFWFCFHSWSIFYFSMWFLLWPISY